MPLFRWPVKQGNQAVKQCTCAGARLARVFGSLVLSEGHRGQGWGLPTNKKQGGATSVGRNQIPLKTVLGFHMIASSL